MSEGKILKREQVFQGKVIDVAVESVELPDGTQVDLEMVRHPGGAAAVALDDQDRVCLLRQFRHASDGWLWELPAGRIEPGESPFGTAQRELLEEAGLEVSEWSELGIMHSSPGIFTEVIHLWLARGLNGVPVEHEHGELIEVHWMPLVQALDWCNDGNITDSKTLVGLYRAGALIRNRLEILSEDPGC
ncbi:NUDIX domain-containing protein [Thiocystis violacea]|uniref:NUDIX domain-containing protein n=1 Tax=Thiocystis violacea TaxID=13725 RepID=UPI0019031607|nr:NUDIX hydrolase [Thiocystis violacea]MBK1722557.1 NUDIX hydrolase [Thiocystis violacea]